MTQEIEIEYKNLLTKEEFDRLLEKLPFPDKPQTQTNYYFETADFALKDLGCALRIREKNGTFTLTLKEPHTSGLLETHDSLTQQEASNWINGNMTDNENVAKRLTTKGISIEKLIYAGSLTTKRRELHYKNVLLVLDNSTYHDRNDYELEIEAVSEASGQETMQEILTDFNIETRDTPNKIERFFKAIGHE